MPGLGTWETLMKHRARAAGTCTEYTKPPPPVHCGEETQLSTGPPTLWIRWDGEQRLLKFLPDLPAPPETLGNPRRKLGRFLETLDETLPAWEETLYLGTLLGFLCGLLAVVLR